MRVAVHHPAREEPDGTPVEASTAAYRMGRIEDFVNPVTGETTPKEEVAAALLEQAKAEFPDCEVTIERLVHNGDAPPRIEEAADGSTTEVPDPFGEGGTSRWVHHEEVPEGAVSPKGGTVSAPEQVVEQTATTGGEPQ